MANYVDTGDLMHEGDIVQLVEGGWGWGIGEDAYLWGSKFEVIDTSPPITVKILCPRYQERQIGGEHNEFQVTTHSHTLKKYQAPQKDILKHVKNGSGFKRF